VPFIGVLFPLAVLGVIVWTISRAMAGRRSEPYGSHDQAAVLRRLFVYGLLLLTLVLAGLGASFAATAIVGRSGDRGGANGLLATGLAFVIVAGPAYALLLRHVLGRMRTSQAERSAGAWTVYMNVALLVALVTTLYFANIVLDDLTTSGDFDADPLAVLVIWGGVWAMHWFWLKAAAGLRGDLHLASGSTAGLVVASTGAGGVLGSLLRQAYDEVTDHPGTAPSPREWLILAVLGAVVWSWYWLREYRRSPHTDLWHTHVILVGSLGGLATAIVAGAMALYTSLVWVVGDPVDTVAKEHFDLVPVSAALLVVGLASWLYHRGVLGGATTERTEPIRAYDYLMAAAGLVATMVATSVAIVAVIDVVTPEPEFSDVRVANRLLLAATLAVIGVPVWSTFWRRIGRHRTADPAGEITSIVRRVHLIVLFGIGGLTGLVCALVVLNTALRDLLDGIFGGRSVRSVGAPFGILASVAGVAWYHLRVFRSDEATIDEIGPVVREMARRYTVVASSTSAAPELLAAEVGATVGRWTRLDSVTEPPFDPKAVLAVAADLPSGDLLVLAAGGGWSVIPLATPSPGAPLVAPPAAPPVAATPPRP
jgi:fluoride ion exporter CrcB/FEX